MHKLIIRILLYGLFIQCFIDYFAGQVIEVFLFGRYWQPMQLCMFLTTFLWFFMYITINPSIQNKRRIKYHWYVLFLGCACFILLGIQRGLKFLYVPFWGDSEVFFWIFISILIGVTANKDDKLIFADLQYFRQLAILVMIAGIIYGVQKNFLGTVFLGLVHFNEYFLLSFYTFLFFVNVIIFGSRKAVDLYGFYISILFQLINFHKAIILPLLITTVTVIILYKKKTVTKANPLKQFIRRILLPTVFALSLVYYITDLLEIGIINRFIDYQLNERILHKSTGDVSGGRFDLWKATYEITKQEPLRGAGVGFRMTADRTNGVDVFRLSKAGISTHNHWLYLFGAIGIPGAIFIIYSFLRYITVSAKAIQKLNDQSTIHCVLPWWAFSCMVSIFGLFGLWNISSVGFVLWGLSIGIVVRTISKKRVHQKVCPKPECIR